MRESRKARPAAVRPGPQLPVVAAATAAVLLIPSAVIWLLLTRAGIESAPVLAAAAMIVALGVRRLVRLLWQGRPASRELPASDLMLWRWLRRRRLERRLEQAVAQLGADPRTLPVDRDPAAQMELIKGLAAALEARDPYTHGHSRRVARYSAMIARTLELPEDQVRKIRTAAVVHDVGKLEVPLEVLNKPGRLTHEEFEVIKTHAPRGAEMVSRLGDPELTEMVAHHHERLDGNGYPSRIGGEAIPLGARIIAVADTFDALTSTRPYRAAKRESEALRILRAEAGTQLDPRAVRAFDRCYKESFHGLLAWPLLASLPHRIWAPIESQVQAATATMTAKVATIVATTAATGVIPVTGIQSDPRDTNRMPTASVRSAPDHATARRPGAATRGLVTAGSSPRGAASGSERKPAEQPGSVGPAQAGPESSPAAGSSAPDSAVPAAPAASAPSPAAPAVPAPADIQGEVADAADDALATASDTGVGEDIPVSDVTEELPVAVPSVKSAGIGDALP